MEEKTNVLKFKVAKFLNDSFYQNMINNIAETIYKRGIKIDQLIKNIEKEENKELLNDIKIKIFDKMFENKYIKENDFMIPNISLFDGYKYDLDLYIGKDHFSKYVLNRVFQERNLEFITEILTRDYRNDLKSLFEREILPQNRDRIPEEQQLFFKELLEFNKDNKDKYMYLKNLYIDAIMGVTDGFSKHSNYANIVKQTIDHNSLIVTRKDIEDRIKSEPNSKIIFSRLSFLNYTDYEKYNYIQKFSNDTRQFSLFYNNFNYEGFDGSFYTIDLYNAKINVTDMSEEKINNLLKALKFIKNITSTEEASLMLDKFNEEVGTKLNIRNLDGLGINSIEVKSNFRLKNLTEEEFNINVEKMKEHNLKLNEEKEQKLLEEKLRIQEIEKNKIEALTNDFENNYLKNL